MNTRPALRTVFPALLLWWCAAAHAEQYAIPLLVAPGPGGDPQGVLRLANDSDAAVAVSIHAIDDAGNRAGPATLTLGAAAAVELTATELRAGSAAKGLAAGLGPLAGNVRLRIDSDAPIVPSAYVRDAGGALAAMNSTVLEAASPRRAAGAEPDGYRYDVTLFHPASNLARESRLRLINPGDAAAEVTIAARDDAGNPAPGGPVRLTLPAGGARTLTAQQLEAGDGASLTGGLGAGVGNWRLSVTSDRPIEAVNVTVGAAGDWRNLSTTAADGWAPQDEAAFEAQFVGRAIVIRDGSGYRGEFHVLAGNRVRIDDIDDGIVDSSEGGYRYARTGRETARMLIEYDAGGVGCMYLHFSAAREGWYSAACTETADPAEYLGGGTWVALDSDAPRLELVPRLEDVQASVSFLAARPVALTLPAAVGGGDGELSYSLSPDVPGLVFDPATRDLGGRPSEPGHFPMTYRVRDASGDTDWRYFNVTILDPLDSDATAYEAGDTLAGIPTGDWRPEAISGGSSHAGENGSIVRLGEGGYVASNEHRYTCDNQGGGGFSLGGCVLENGRVTSGRIIQSPVRGADGSGGGGVEYAQSFGLARGDRPRGITFANGRFFIVDFIDAKVYAYTPDGQREPDADFDTQGGNDRPEGIAFANGRFFIADYDDAKVYAYTPNGQRLPDADFQLQDGNDEPSGIAFANGRFFIVDWNDAKVYAYTPDGQREPDADFVLQDGNYNPTGIAFANGRFFITDTLDDKVYAYTPDGQREPDADFDTQDGNDHPSGIAFANGRFFIVDDRDAKVYAYTPDGQREPDADFDTQDGNDHPFGIAFANRRFFIVDYGDAKVFAYTSDGQRVPDTDFDTQDGNDYPFGIAFANGRFFIVDWNDAKVYAYTPNGQRLPDADFQLQDGNDEPSGIAFANGRFFIADYDDAKVYAYTPNGQRLPDADFQLQDGNDEPSGIAFANGRFFIVDWNDAKVYAYTPDGQRLPDADFQLHGGNHLPSGIVVANGRFYVVDGYRIHVFAYRATGGSAGTDGIAADTSPSFANVARPGDRTYTVGAAIAALTLPTASGGDGALAYALTPSIPGLTFDAATRRLTGTPTDAGTWNVTYTATDADGDTDSLRFAVTVEAAGGGGSFDFARGFDLQDGNGVPAGGIAFANGRFFIVDRDDHKVYAYTPAGQRVPDADFNLQDGNDDPKGIAFANGRFFIVDRDDDKVYAYTPAGQRVPDANFNLQDGIFSPTGIAFANGRFFIADSLHDKVYAYTPAGQRVPDADFNLQDGYDSPGGIVFANGRFFITYLYDDKVYAYTPAGQRDPDTDFVLQDFNFNPRGITFANGRFFIVNIFPAKVYAYSASGQHNDDHGNIPASATPAAIGSDTPGRLDAGDTDWFRVEVDAPGTLAVYTTGSVDTVGRLENASGTLVRTNDDSGAGTNFSISAPVAAGTYFVRVEGYGANTAGAYTLHVRIGEPTTGGGEPTRDGDCYVGLLVNSGESCTYPGASETFSVTADGRGRFIFFTSGESINIVNSNINGRLYDIAASHQGGGVWRIDRVGG